MSLQPAPATRKSSRIKKNISVGALDIFVKREILGTGLCLNFVVQRNVWLRYRADKEELFSCVIQNKSRIIGI